MIANNGFVDDTATANEDVLGANFSCKDIHETFDELRVKAQPKKTVHVLGGDHNWIQRTQLQLEQNPAQIQDLQGMLQKASHESTFSMLDARAITCLRMGNLFFKNW